MKEAEAEAEAGFSACKWLNMEQLWETTILVTGGTGLVGYNVLRELAAVSGNLKLRIIALIRDREKAQRMFAPFLDQVELVCGDVLQMPEILEPIDYILHGASITSSKTFVEKPVETIMTAVTGTRNMLELGRKKNVRSMVYLSSMEAYGTVRQEKLLSEVDVGYVNPLSLRSSYPESKRLCENLCVAYAAEYGVPVKIARLAQTFGPGMPKNDNRAVVQFTRNALANADIQIKASGESARMYLHTFDAVTGLLTLLLSGENATAYNIANKETYCSVRGLAEMIVKTAGCMSRVLVNTGTEEERLVYPPDSFLRLHTAKIEDLGWKPCYDLKRSIQSVIQYLEENR